MNREDVPDEAVLAGLSALWGGQSCEQLDEITVREIYIAMRAIIEADE